jgi:hypothetical protein
MPIALGPIIPMPRIFDEAKAREFYVEYLGCEVDWEHRFEPGTPLYMQVSRGNLILHLSEHYGDGCPGALVYVKIAGVDELHAELSAKKYKYSRPDVIEAPWNARVLTLIDPFGNRINFNEPKGG